MIRRSAITAPVSEGELVKQLEMPEAETVTS
jgi:hypothetical protein